VNFDTEKLVYRNFADCRHLVYYKSQCC